MTSGSTAHTRNQNTWWPVGRGRGTLRARRQRTSLWRAPGIDSDLKVSKITGRLSLKEKRRLADMRNTRTIHDVDVHNIISSSISHNWLIPVFYWHASFLHSNQLTLKFTCIAHLVFAENGLCGLFGNLSPSYWTGRRQAILSLSTITYDNYIIIHHSCYKPKEKRNTRMSGCLGP